MPEKNIDLHGSAPDKHKSALLLIDVINDLDFPKADQLLKYARPMARNLLRLKRRAQKAGVPVIYVNDNFGRWKSDFRRTVEHCTRHGHARDVVKLLRPEESDYFVLKPKHSGFFSTTLETLLRYLETQTLILTGIAGNFCVLFTANDAYMRDFNLFVPSDCTVSNTKKENDSALALMRKFLKAGHAFVLENRIARPAKKGARFKTSPFKSVVTVRIAHEVLRDFDLRLPIVFGNSLRFAWGG
jgi:nicotinamidase-related amidase